MMRPIAFQGLLAGMVFLLSGCADLQTSGGNTSETQNTLTGILVDTHGHPRAGDSVFVRPSRWTAEDASPAGDAAGTLWQAVTDSNGRWSLSGIESGSWTVEARSGKLGRLCARVELGRAGTRIELPVDTLYPRRHVAGRLEGAPLTGLRGRVYVYGTTIQAEVDSAGRFELRGVPVGDLRLVAKAFRPDGMAFRSEGSCRLGPYGTVEPVSLPLSSFAEEDYGSWPNKRSARLRYSGAGGLVLESSLDTFPILVRLNGAPVSALDPTGSSLRFADQNGVHLRYEIERWDPALHEADVWLLVNANRKRSDNYGIVVHWGRSDAADWSDGAAVFDTARGWVGVWHFSGGDPLRDVTANRLRLSGTGWERSKGLAGDGIRLGTDSRLSVPTAMASLGGWAMASSWVHVNSVGMTGNVLSLASNAEDTIAWSLRIGEEAGVRRCAFKTRAQGNQAFPAGTSLALPSREWLHLGGLIEAVRDRPRLRFVLDSTMAYEELFDSVSVPPANRVLEIGGGWSGVLDEVRVRRWTLHSDAMSLEWGTGRPEATVVWWE